MSKPLAEGETIELKDIYVGSKKELKSRLIITKLTEENKIKRERALYEKANLISTGKSKGKSEEKIDTILRSYKLGFTTEQIAKIVELKEEQVIDILSKNNLVHKN